MTATPQSELRCRLRTLAVAAGERDPDDAVTASTAEPLANPGDADAIREFIHAYDPNNLLATPPGDESTLKTGTCGTYLQRLTESARRISLTDADAADVNGVLQTLQDEGTKAWTLHGYSTALRRFYGFHDFGPDPDAITRIDTPNGSSFDPDDMLTREEIHDLLDAADAPRDRAVLALLIYTGMRNNALRTLRVRDVDVQAGRTGTWTFNEEMSDGLKNADKHGTTRPLLGARGPVREWLQYHPTGDPDHYLITGRPDYGRANPTRPVAGSTIRRVMDRLVERADNPDIDRKPTHPHMMRHNFVTVCKRDYELPDETVRHLIGHAPGSRVMETTYAHLADEDHIERAEVAAGLREESEDESPLTPSVCDCGEPLSARARACEVCGRVYSPDAKPAEDQIRADMKRTYAETDPTDPDDMSLQEKLNRLDALMNDPELRQHARDQAGEQE